MFDQYKNSDFEQNELQQQQPTKRKLAFILAGSAFALLCFLFLLGSFQDTSVSSSAKHISLDQITALIQQIEKVQEKLSERVTYIEALVERGQAASLFTNHATAVETIEKNSLVESLPTDVKIVEQVPQKIGKPVIIASNTAKESTKQKSTKKVHVVAKGDTLSEISKKYYGTGNFWQKIYEANKDRIHNINNLKVGSELIIPNRESFQ